MKASIYLGEPLKAALVLTADDNPETGVRSRRINNIAERYLDMIADAMPEFSRAEWCAIMDANNGLGVTGDLMSLLMAWANVADSPELDGKWDIDHSALAEKIRALPRASRLAVGEAVERFWSRSELPTDEALTKASVKISP